MTKTEHLQFLVLMIPTFVILAAAAVSMADLSLTSQPQAYTVAAASQSVGADYPLWWDDRATE